MNTKQPRPPTADKIHLKGLAVPIPNLSLSMLQETISPPQPSLEGRLLHHISGAISLRLCGDSDMNDCGCVIRKLRQTKGPRVNTFIPLREVNYNRLTCGAPHCSTAANRSARANIPRLAGSGPNTLISRLTMNLRELSLFVRI